MTQNSFCTVLKEVFINLLASWFLKGFTLSLCLGKKQSDIILTVVLLAQAEPSVGLYGYSIPPITIMYSPTEICMNVASSVGGRTRTH